MSWPMFPEHRVRQSRHPQSASQQPFGQNGQTLTKSSSCPAFPKSGVSKTNGLHGTLTRQRYGKTLRPSELKRSASSSAMGVASNGLNQLYSTEDDFFRKIYDNYGPRKKKLASSNPRDKPSSLSIVYRMSEVGLHAKRNSEEMAENRNFLNGYRALARGGFSLPDEFMKQFQSPPNIDLQEQNQDTRVQEFPPPLLQKHHSMLDRIDACDERALFNGRTLCSQREFLNEYGAMGGRKPRAIQPQLKQPWLQVEIPKPVAFQASDIEPLASTEDALPNEFNASVSTEVWEGHV